MNQKSCRNDTEAFFALLRAGLWEKVSENDNPNENLFKSLNWDEVQMLAEEQSVMGIVAAGVQNAGVTIPLDQKLKFLGMCQLIEQRNVAMNQFIAELIQKLREAGIKAVLLKGQGIAQCHERPYWRSSGDVDLLLDEENYKKANDFLQPMALESGKEFKYEQHQSITIGTFTVELHGSQRCGLSSRMDHVIDEVQREVCENGKVRSWLNGDVPVNLPAPDEDVILVFTHFLKHFYKGRLGLRQICDWCRLLWVNRNTIDRSLLERWLHKMKLVTEWEGFASYAVVYLGMTKEAMPLSESSDKWRFKTNRIMDFILKSGNFGHNRDSSYWNKYPYLVRKAFSMKRRVGDLINHSRIFPLDTLRFCPAIIGHGLSSAMKGE